MAGLMLFRNSVLPVCGMNKNTAMIIRQDQIETLYLQCNPFKEMRE